MSYKTIINSLQPIEYSKYKDITSNEKLMLYSAYVLNSKNVPLTFNYLCIAAFKIFPETFCCDEEFKEFPSVDRLNRTLMHLKYVKNGKPYIAGTVENGYSLTNHGKSVAIEVESIISNGVVDKSIKAPVIDKYKKGFSKDYINFKNSKGYQEYLSSGLVDIMNIFEYYHIIPYTQEKVIKKDLESIYEYAKNEKDEKCINYIEKLFKEL